MHKIMDQYALLFKKQSDLSLWANGCDTAASCWYALFLNCSLCWPSIFLAIMGWIIHLSLNIIYLFTWWLYLRHNCSALVLDVWLKVDQLCIGFQESEDCRGDRLPSPKEELDTEPCSAPSPNRISEYEFVTRSNPRKGSSHRKHHISWSPSEVMKLIEGVTKCGVGRWAEIKRLLFPSSSRRTSVDLKVVYCVAVLV